MPLGRDSPATLRQSSTQPGAGPPRCACFSDSTHPVRPGREPSERAEKGHSEPRRPYLHLPPGFAGLGFSTLPGAPCALLFWSGCLREPPEARGQSAHQGVARRGSTRMPVPGAVEAVAQSVSGHAMPGPLGAGLEDKLWGGPRGRGRKGAWDLKGSRGVCPVQRASSSSAGRARAPQADPRAHPGATEGAAAVRGGRRTTPHPGA